MEGADERFDGVLLNIAQQAGSIDAILDSFFGFLQRKTDFFTGAQDEQAAEQMVLKYYKKHWKAGQKKRQEIQEKNRIADEERKQRADEQRKKDEAAYQKQQEDISKKAKIEEVTDEEAAKKEEAAGADDGAKSDDEAGSKEPPPLGNGGKTDKYTWTQTLGALEVYVNVRPGIKAKEIICDIGNDTLKLGVKGEPLILTGKMHAKVKPDDC